MSRLNKTDWLLESLMGPVTLFNKLPIMEEALARFERHNYMVHRFDCSQHESQETMFNAVLHSTGCLGQDHFYRHIQPIQFWDLLRSIEIPEESGLVIAFQHFDDFHHRLPESAQAMVKSLAREHFYELSHGLRLITLAHSETRDLKLETLMTIEAVWSQHMTFTEEADRKRKFLEAQYEGSRWLQSHVKSRLHPSAFISALLSVTGAKDTKALANMELEAAEMIQLLQDYDFSPFEVKAKNDSNRN